MEKLEPAHDAVVIRWLGRSRVGRGAQSMAGFIVEPPWAAEGMIFPAKGWVMMLA
ncbi:MAG: hypothetical protein OXF88_16345 [Rhodobacteraceae bacterium]|nr:hypothetical protein [Paracoccaceae bacterium]